MLPGDFGKHDNAFRTFSSGLLHALAQHGQRFFKRNVLPLPVDFQPGFGKSVGIVEALQGRLAPGAEFALVDRMERVAFQLE